MMWASMDPLQETIMPATLHAVPDAAVVLTKATLRAAEQLGLNNSALASVIGVSEPTISRLKANGRTISPDSKEGELALMLIRVFRSLDPLVGGDAHKRKLWMESHNNALLGSPIQLIRKAEGLVRTLSYLDGMRAAT